MAVRQVSAEAQHSLNQWHRRRTLHCNQSRRSKHRQTIRRQACREKGTNNSAEETRGEEAHESGKENENDSVDVVETENSTNALESVREETVEGRAEEPSQMSAPASEHPPLTPQEIILDKEENAQSLCTAKQGDAGGLRGIDEERS